MGVLPLQFKGGDTRRHRSASRATRRSTSLGRATIKPQQELTLVIRASDGTTRDVPVLCRIDTPIEVDYYQHGGILPFVLRELIAA